jgi:GNAT superfamily N-acetyltransferase
MSVIRRARLLDLPELLSMIEEFCDIDRHPFDQERVLAGLRPLLSDDTHGHVWVILDRDTTDIAGGYAVVTWSWSLESGGRDCILDELYVRARGRGLGAAALAEVLTAAARAGANAMFLETEAHNNRVRRFYSRAGFVREDSVWMSRSLQDVAR